VKRLFPVQTYALLFFFFSFCGVAPAQSKTVPDNFTSSTFDSIVHAALQNYIDPDSVNVSRCYSGAAEAALRSLPYPLILYPKQFYENRSKYQKQDRIVPGTLIVISKEDPFVVLKPDYQKLEEMGEKADKLERERRKGLSAEQKQKEAEENKQESLAEMKALEETWARTGFSKKDFERVLAWIQANKGEYTTLPSTYKGPDPYKDNPFGMNYVYFAATNGFLQTMDPHSGIMDLESWEKVRSESEDSSFEGIGALLRGGGNQDVIVETPLANSPALRSGLRAGDIIRKVDEKAIEGLPLSDVVRMIRGKKDTEVVLDVERPTTGDFLPIRIKRGVITQLAVSSYLYGKTKIGVIKISSFLYKGHETSEMVEEEYRKLLEQTDKLEGLVIDLRNNPGGFLDEAINVAGLFLPEGKVVVQTKGKGTPLQPRANTFEKVIKNVPVIVLINSGSASASEIVASALQDYNAALVIGERSFGKATVQEMRTYGSVIIKLTTARYYAPRGYTIQVAGVEPDVQISDELDGTFPLRFREEDMWRHLPKLKTRQISTPKRAWVNHLKGVVGNNEKAESYIQKHKNDAEKPDYMMIRAVSFFNALKQFPHP